MKLTRFTFSKLRWLLLNPVFKAKPFSVIRRLLVWEWIRLMNRPVRATFDGSHSIVLRPNEGASRLTNESIIVRTLARCLLSHAACKRLEIQTAGS
jgi:hypothetical protein